MCGYRLMGGLIGGVENKRVDWVRLAAIFARAALAARAAELIQARIAAGLSQEELAAKLGLKPQQIQRYEAGNYQGATSLGRVNPILRALGVKLRPGAELRLVS